MQCWLDRDKLTALNEQADEMKMSGFYPLCFSGGGTSKFDSLEPVQIKRKRSREGYAKAGVVWRMDIKRGLKQIGAPLHAVC